MNTNSLAKKFIILLVILLILLVVFGCSSSKKKGENDRKDRAMKEALARNATIVAEEAKRYSLSICGGGTIVCAQDGKNCKPFGLATNPEVCDKGPTLTCICPESTACVMDKGKGLLPTKHDGNCLKSSEIE